MPNGETHLGTDQEWFTTVWQRMAGCGPSTASNLLLYLSKTSRFAFSSEIRDRSALLRLMEYAWKNITPGMRGVNKTSLFYDGINRMLEEHGSELRHLALDIPKDHDRRPDIDTVAAFIKAGLSLDSPIAFLNLDSGDVPELEWWHWMTAYALEFDEPSQTYRLSLSDNGKVQTIDLNLWLSSSKLGGGFVYVA